MKNYKGENDIVVLKRKGCKIIVVPIFLRRKLLDNAHKDFGHPSMQKMLIKYLLIIMTQDVSLYVKH